MLDWLVEFTQYLNSQGYNITAEHITRVFELNDEGISIIDDETLIALMQLCFCHNQVEEQELPNHYRYFVQHKEVVRRDNKEREKAEERLTGYSQKKNELDDKLKNFAQLYKDKEDELKHERDSKLKEARDNYVPNKSVSDSLKESLKKLEDVIQNSEMLSDSLKEVMRNPDKARANNKTMRKEVVDVMEQALWNMDMDLVEACEVMDNVLKEQDENSKGLEKQLEGIRGRYDVKLQDLKKQKALEEAESKKLQKELEKQIQQAKTIIKERSKTHRLSFNGGTNSVQQHGVIHEEDMMPDKNITSLTKAEVQQVYKGIRKNSLKLKTRLLRNINTKQRKEIDLQQTIKQACKTGGLPMQLVFRKPMPSKAKLIVVADISGSCSKASKMVLTFVHALKSVFTSGCKVFVFVNSLYDVSDIMQSDNVEEVIDEVFQQIPTRGVYSNYYNPLETMWNDYKQEITKDSIILFIGDARNNKNPTGETLLKNITRKAKQAYWLNTEETDKWGHADSLAPLYSKYTPMYEILKPKDIVQFLNTMK